MSVLFGQDACQTYASPMLANQTYAKRSLKSVRRLSFRHLQVLHLTVEYLSVKICFSFFSIFSTTPKYINEVKTIVMVSNVLKDNKEVTEEAKSSSDKIEVQLKHQRTLIDEDTLIPRLVANGTKLVHSWEDQYYVVNEYRANAHQV